MNLNLKQTLKFFVFSKSLWQLHDLGDWSCIKLRKKECLKQGEQGQLSWVYNSSGTMLGSMFAYQY